MDTRTMRAHITRGEDDATTDDEECRLLGTAIDAGRKGDTMSGST